MFQLSYSKLLAGHPVPVRYRTEKMVLVFVENDKDEIWKMRSSCSVIVSMVASVCLATFSFSILYIMISRACWRLSSWLHLFKCCNITLDMVCCLLVTNLTALHFREFRTSWHITSFIKFTRRIICARKNWLVIHGMYFTDRVGDYGSFPSYLEIRLGKFCYGWCCKANRVICHFDYRSV